MGVTFPSFSKYITREKLKKKLEESGGLTFQIPQFNTEYGTRRVPAVKKIKVLKEGKVLKIKVAKDKKEKDKGLRKKLTSKMVQDSMDLLLSGSVVLSPQVVERVTAPRSPGKLRGSAYAAIKKGTVEKVKPSFFHKFYLMNAFLVFITTISSTLLPVSFLIICHLHYVNLPISTTRQLFSLLSPPVNF